MDTEDRGCICVVGESEVHREGLVEDEGSRVRGGGVEHRLSAACLMSFSSNLAADTVYG